MSNPDQRTAAGKNAVRIELAPPSFTMRVGNRRLTMSWRPRKQVPVLLTGLLRRSWRAMFGRGLRISMTAAAICAAWNVPALAAAPPVNTLPTGGVITAGAATITKNGNTLNINQSTQQAIGNFTSFSIGANATVDISQPNSAAAFLARVTGTDPSLIYGLLKANGTVALINQNGIMVGPGGVVDVARFIASTLNITDGDFLAGKLTFTAGSTVGNVDNQGTIKTATGGSVYLIGANVSNSGVIQSPNGEILLAAGQTVQLIDTATPGVTVNVTGTAGSVTNLGTITAEAGRIGIAAGLINNSGNINASSVVSEGGRIFLRASQKLTTTASSNITADGATKGGSVVLYSDKVAYLDGGISATGAAGQGGFIETSGKESLDVVKLPTAGSGGTWLIDPYDLEVVASGGTGTLSGNVVSSSGGVSSVNASVISGQLNGGTSVTLTTGAGGSASGGNITVSAAINKSSMGDAALTLNADNSIFINADITSTAGKLNLNLNSNLSGIAGDHTVNVSGALVRLNGGAINVSDGSGNSGNGNIAIRNGATIDLNQSGRLNAGNLNISSGGALTGAYSSSVTLQGTLTNGGTVDFANAAITVGDKIINNGQFTTANVSINTVNGFINSVGAIANLNYMTNFQTGSFTNAGTANVLDAGGGITFENGFSNSGVMNIRGMITSNALASNGVGGTMNVGNDGGTTRFKGSGDVSNSGTMTILGATNTVYVNNGLTNNAGGVITISGTSNSLTAGSWTNAGSLTIGAGSNLVNATTASNTGIISMTDATVNFDTFSNDGGTISGTGSITSNGQFTNNGTISPGGDGTIGQLGINGNFTQTATGVLNIDVASATSYDTFYLNAPTTVGLGGTLQSKLLGSYVPTLNTRLSPIVFTNQNAGSSYFRHVLGNVIDTGNGLQMLKVDYKGALALVMSGSETLTYTGNSDTHWGTALSWTGGVLPTAIDDVIVGDGVTLLHRSDDGVDTVKSITLNSSSALTINGGTVNTGSISGLNNGRVTVTGMATDEGGGGGDFNGFSFNNGGGGVSAPNAGILNVSGTANINSLTLSNGGVVNGGTGSVLNVNGDFSQSGGAIINSNGTVALSRTEGNVVVGNITARNLSLTTQGGSISQTNALHVTGQLTTSSTNGTTLGNAGNQIAAYAGTNSNSGDITLTNNLNTTDTSVVRLLGITNNGGGIAVDNTGGMALNGDAKSAGAVSLVTHSPLTINGNITAANGITLAAGTPGSGLAADAIVVNGQLTSTGGVISLLAGGSLNVNGNINGVFIPAPPPNPQPTYGVGVTLNGVLVGPPVPVVASTTTPSTTTPITTTPITTPTDTTSQIDRSVNNPQTASTSNTPSTGSNPVTDNTLTTGGGAGTFGGEDTEPAGGQSTPAGNGKKVVKLYCS